MHAHKRCSNKILRNELTLKISICICVYDNVTCTVHAVRTGYTHAAHAKVRSSRSEEHQLPSKEAYRLFHEDYQCVICFMGAIATLRLGKNPSLSLLFIKSLLGTVEGGDGKQIMPWLLSKAFSAKCTCCKMFKALWRTLYCPISTNRQCM